MTSLHFTLFQFYFLTFCYYATLRVDRPLACFCCRPPSYRPSSIHPLSPPSTFPLTHPLTSSPLLSPHLPSSHSTTFPLTPPLTSSFLLSPLLSPHLPSSHPTTFPLTPPLNLYLSISLSLFFNPLQISVDVCTYLCFFLPADIRM